MKKTIASKLNEDGFFTPQIDVEMGPEETRIRLMYEDLNELEKQRPLKLSDSEKIDALMDDARGKEWIKQKDSEYEIAIKDFQTKFSAMENDITKNEIEYHSKLEKMPKGTLTF